MRNVSHYALYDLTVAKCNSMQIENLQIAVAKCNSMDLFHCHVEKKSVIKGILKCVSDQDIS